MRARPNIRINPGSGESGFPSSKPATANRTEINPGQKLKASTDLLHKDQAIITGDGLKEQLTDGLVYEKKRHLERFYPATRREVFDISFKDHPNLGFSISRSTHNNGGSKSIGIFFTAPGNLNFVKESLINNPNGYRLRSLPQTSNFVLSVDIGDPLYIFDARGKLLGKIAKDPTERDAVKLCFKYEATIKNAKKANP
jgi:hypothetical protein